MNGRHTWGFQRRSSDMVRDWIAIGLIPLFCLLLQHSDRGVWLPFVWVDLAAVYVIACWIMAGLAVDLLRQQRSLWLGCLLGMACFAVGVSATSWTTSNQLSGTAVRMLTAAGIVLTARSSAGILVTENNHTSTASPLAWVLACVVACVPPAMYGYHRTEQHLKQLAERIERQQIGAAERLSTNLMALRPQARVQEQPLYYVDRKLRTQLDQYRREIETLSAAPPSPENQWRLAMLHAVCGQLDDAETLALPLTTAGPLAIDAALLLGTLYQEQSRWRPSRESFTRALAMSKANPQRHPDQIQALIGIAFAERKLGNRAAAESAYLRALALEPTAARHYLIAQFYEDTQRSSSAAHHVHLASKLNPRLYGDSADAMLNRLSSNDLNCLSIYRSR